MIIRNKATGNYYIKCHSRGYDLYEEYQTEKGETASRIAGHYSTLSGPIHQIVRERLAKIGGTWSFKKYLKIYLEGLNKLTGLEQLCKKELEELDKIIEIEEP